MIDQVLFCVADEWHAEALGLLGTPGVQTPNLDALAADGTVLTNHWCQASPCGPSRSSMLTGTHLPTHGQWTNRHPADHGLTTLPAAIRAAGVDPILVGYTDTPQRPDATGLDLIDPAFDVALTFTWQDGFPTWRARLADEGYDVSGDDVATTGPLGLYAPDGAPDEHGLAPGRYRSEDSDVAFLTDATLAVMQERASLEGPSLLHVNWLRPHPPLTPPRPYHRLVDPDEVEPPRRARTLAEQATAHPYFELTVPGRRMDEYLQRPVTIEDITERDERHLLAAYYGLVAEVDHHVGRLVDELKRSGRYDSTMIIITSDHGDSLGDHWIYGRRGPFDDHFKVPCIIRDPRPAAAATRGERIDAFTTNIDLYPTICDAHDVPTPAEVEGRSLTDLLAGQADPTWRRHVRYDMSWDDHVRATDRDRAGGSAVDRRFTVVRTDEHRLVTFGSLPPMLFDLAEDPNEVVDLGTDPARRGLRAELAALERLETDEKPA